MSTFWMGVAIALTLLTLATPAFAPLAVVAGLLAFRKPALAAGVGVALGVLIAAAVSLVLLADWQSGSQPPAFTRDASDTAELNS